MKCMNNPETSLSTYFVIQKENAYFLVKNKKRLK